MPTPSGKETAQERDTRQRAEWYAAVRGSLTDGQRADAARDAEFSDCCLPEYPAGDVLTLRAGRRTITIDQGQAQALALADALRAIGRPTIGERTTFGIAAGRRSIRYAVIRPRA